MTTNPDATRPDTASGAGLSEAEYRKTATIRASQWWKEGDHPAIEPYSDGARGWCPTLEGGHVVSPGDWIATGVKGEHWPIKADVFAATYEPVALSASHTDAAAGWRDITAKEARAEVGDTNHPNALLSAFNAIARRRMAAGAGTGAAGRGKYGDAICSYDDGSEVHWSGCSGGAHKDGAWAHVTLAFIDAEGKTDLREYTADDVITQAATAPAGGGELREIGANLDHIDTLLSYARWSISDESPGHHPTMPSAVGQAAGALDALYNLTGAPSRRLRSAGYPLRAPTPDAPAKPGQGGEGALLTREWLIAIIRGSTFAADAAAIILLHPALSAPPADAALRSAAENFLSSYRAKYRRVSGGFRTDAPLHDEAKALASAFALTTAAPADGAPEVEG